MDTIVIRGGAQLEGEVVVSGSKNAALPLLFATLLTRERSVVRNVPALADVRTTIQVLEHLGARVTPSVDGHEMVVETGAVACTEAPYELVKTMRASFLVLGPLLARFGHARVSTPGGCAIGARPVDLHLSGLQKLGAQLRISEGYVEARAERLRGAKIVLDFPSVGATQQLMMAAALAEGTTVLEEAGVVVRERESGIRVEGKGRLAAVDARTMPYPGFPTDLQAQFMTLMTRATGTSTLTETIFENRFLHAQELVRMGADIHVDGHHAIVRGPQSLSGAPVMATDLRASVCLVLAGLAARGTTRVSRVYHLDRGYEHIEAKLSALGADVAREKASA